MFASNIASATPHVVPILARSQQTARSIKISLDDDYVLSSSEIVAALGNSKGIAFIPDDDSYNVDLPTTTDLLEIFALVQGTPAEVGDCFSFPVAVANGYYLYINDGGDGSTTIITDNELYGTSYYGAATLRFVVCAMDTIRVSLRDIGWEN